MGILETLTIIFIVLKLIDVIDWTWVQVLTPLFIALAIYFIMFLFLVLYYAKVQIWDMRDK